MTAVNQSKSVPCSIVSRRSSSSKSIYAWIRCRSRRKTETNVNAKEVQFQTASHSLIVLRDYRGREFQTEGSATQNTPSSNYGPSYSVVGGQWRI